MASAVGLCTTSNAPAWSAATPSTLSASDIVTTTTRGGFGKARIASSDADSVELRHHEVERHDVGRGLRDLLERVETVTRDGHDLDLPEAGDRFRDRGAAFARRRGDAVGLAARVVGELRHLALEASSSAAAVALVPASCVMCSALFEIDAAERAISSIDVAADSMVAAFFSAAAATCSTAVATLVTLPTVSRIALSSCRAWSATTRFERASSSTVAAVSSTLVARSAALAASWRHRRVGVRDAGGEVPDAVPDVLRVRSEARDALRHLLDGRGDLFDRRRVGLPVRGHVGDRRVHRDAVASSCSLDAARSSAFRLTLLIERAISSSVTAVPSLSSASCVPSRRDSSNDVATAVRDVALPSIAARGCRAVADLAL